MGIRIAALVTLNLSTTSNKKVVTGSTDLEDGKITEPYAPKGSGRDHLHTAVMLPAKHSDFPPSYATVF